MSQSTTSKTTKKNKKTSMRGWKPPDPPEVRARKLAEKMLQTLETELAREVPAEEKYERLLGPKGLLAHLPKLMQLLAQIGPEREEADEPISAEDMKLLREWLRR